MTLEFLIGRHRNFLALLVMVAFAIAASGEPVKPGWTHRFEPVDGITTAGQPNEEGLMQLADDGYAAVIDLRAPGEDRGLDERGIVERLGMDYVSLPIVDGEDVNFENAAKLDNILGRFSRPVLIHCGSGNRVGALLALREKINGAEDDAALAFGRSAGLTSLENTVKARLANE